MTSASLVSQLVMQTMSLTLHAREIFPSMLDDAHCIFVSLQNIPLEVSKLITSQATRHTRVSLGLLVNMQSRAEQHTIHIITLTLCSFHCIVHNVNHLKNGKKL